MFLFCQWFTYSALFGMSPIPAQCLPLWWRRPAHARGVKAGDPALGQATDPPAGLPLWWRRPPAHARWVKARIQPWARPPAPQQGHGCISISVHQTLKILNATPVWDGKRALNLPGVPPKAVASS